MTIVGAAVFYLFWSRGVLSNPNQEGYVFVAFAISAASVLVPTMLFGLLPLRCRCGSTDIEYGGSPGGTFSWGDCKKCGAKDV